MTGDRGEAVLICGSNCARPYEETISSHDRRVSSIRLGHVLSVYTICGIYYLWVLPEKSAAPKRTTVTTNCKDKPDPIAGANQRIFGCHLAEEACSSVVVVRMGIHYQLVKPSPSSFSTGSTLCKCILIGHRQMFCAECLTYV